MTVKTISALLAIAASSTIALAQSGTAPNLKEIMQGLQDDTVAVLAGLLTEDFAAVAVGASSIAEHPRIPAEQVQRVALALGPEMAAFKQLDQLVHDLSLSVQAAAKEKDRDRAIADYQRMVDGCFNCHAAYKDRVTAALNAADEPD